MPTEIRNPKTMDNLHLSDEKIVKANIKQCKVTARALFRIEFLNTRILKSYFKRKSI